MQQVQLELLNPVFGFINSFCSAANLFSNLLANGGVKIGFGSTREKLCAAFVLGEGALFRDTSGFLVEARFLIARVSNAFLVSVRSCTYRVLNKIGDAVSMSS